MSREYTIKLNEEELEEMIYATLEYKLFKNSEQAKLFVEKLQQTKQKPINIKSSIEKLLMLDTDELQVIKTTLEKELSTDTEQEILKAVLWKIEMAMRNTGCEGCCEGCSGLGGQCLTSKKCEKWKQQ